MKILQVSNRIPFPLNEGGTIGIFNYTKGFGQTGNDVTFIALNAQKHNINIDEAKTELEKYCKFYYININTDINIFKAFFNLFSSKSYNVQRFFNNQFSKKLKEILQAGSYDIIQVEGIYASMYIDVLRKFSKSPIVLRQHNVEFQIWERMADNEKNIIKKWYLKLLAKRLKSFEISQLNLYDAIIPVTENDAEIFKKNNCIKPIFVSPACIETEYYENSNIETPNPYYIYHLGSLEWLPNREAVIWFIEKVWDEISKTDNRFKLFVAGKNTPDFFKKYETENLIIAGEVEDANEFIKNKSINIVPLLSGSGIRLKILEAMAAQKLVISTKIGAQGIKYTNNKNIIIADTPDEYIKLFKKISENPEHFNPIKQNAKNLIEEEYSANAIVRRLINYYKTTFDLI